MQSAYRGDSAKQGWTHEADLLGGQRIDLEGLHAAVTDQTHAVLVALADGTLVACVEITNRGNAIAYLGMLSVDPTLQAQGLGRQLINAAEQHAQKQWGTRVMEMTVIVQRVELIAYYERRGYRNTGKTAPFPMDDPRFGIPFRRDLEFVVLEKVLTP